MGWDLDKEELICSTCGVPRGWDVNLHFTRPISLNFEDPTCGFCDECEEDSQDFYDNNKRRGQEKYKRKRQKKKLRQCKENLHQHVNPKDSNARVKNEEKKNHGTIVAKREREKWGERKKSKKKLSNEKNPTIIIVCKFKSSTMEEVAASISNMTPRSKSPFTAFAFSNWIAWVMASIVSE